MKAVYLRIGLIVLPLVILALTNTASLLRADPAAADTPEVKAVRDVLLDWDKKGPTFTLEQERKCYHSENDKEAKYLDFVAHENWEESKTQLVIRNKWGADAEAKFVHFLGGSTMEDDQACDIKVDGDHAVARWENIKDAPPLPLIKVDGHWLVDGHAMYEEAVKDDPSKEPDPVPTAKLMKQAAADIAADKFDDSASFMDDFKVKYGKAMER